MKLITAIVNKDDALSVQHSLTEAGFSVTRLATTGGFLQAGNVTFITATDDGRVDEALDHIAEHCQMRKLYMPATSSFGLGVGDATPVEVSVGGATVFVQNIERFEKL
ncbi:MAG: cyclic-di-AMP receptor [Oscillospiraceae bacterium]|nr:cyclic-di-AMP receptor [Oscillospiraceae bacterium]